MSAIEKSYEITDAKISFVSLVDKAANKRKFLLTKAKDGKALFSTYGRIVKKDSENHYVTGIVYEPMEEDAHGNYMTAEEITKAAYWFAKNGDKVDLQHSFEPLSGATVVENWIAKADFEIDGEAIQKGTWLMTVEISDENVWNGVEKGEITGFSMGGLGNYSEEDIELDNINKRETGEKKGLLKQLAAALGLNVVEKGAMAEIYEERSRGSLFWNAFNTLEEILYSYDNITGRPRFETDENKVRECLEEFNRIITNILACKDNVTKTIYTDRPIEKAGKKMSGRNKETLNGIYESLGTFLAEFDESPEASDEINTENNGKDGKKSKKEELEVTKQEIEEIVSKSITAAIAKAAAENDTTNEDENEKTNDGKKEKEVEKSETDITSKDIEEMVTAAVEKALTPKSEETSGGQIQEMINDAIAKALDPVLKSKGLPSNLNDSGIEKAAGDTHYLHGIL